MNYLQDIIFSDASTEFTNFWGKQMDLTDIPLYSSLVPPVPAKLKLLRYFCP